MKISSTLASWSNAHLCTGLWLERSARCSASLSLWYWVTTFNQTHTRTHTSKPEENSSVNRHSWRHFTFSPLPTANMTFSHFPSEPRRLLPITSNPSHVPATAVGPGQAWVQAAVRGWGGRTPHLASAALFLSGLLSPHPSPSLSWDHVCSGCSFPAGTSCQGPLPWPLGGSFLTLSWRLFLHL